MSGMEGLMCTTESCALCRRPFPTQILEGFDAWQSNVRAVFCPDLSREESIELTNAFHLPNVDDEITVPLTGPLRSITVLRGQQSGRPRTDQTAFCFHEWCYTVVEGKWKVYNKSVLFKLARSITPDPAVWEEVCERRDLDSTSMLQLLADDTSASISTLPTELRIEIWQYAGLQTPYGAFLVCKEISRLARSLCYPLSYCIALRRGSRLSAKMISIFGTEYIRGLNIGNDYQGNILGDTTEVVYISSLGGICAIRLQGPGWESHWIGKKPATNCTWYGRIRGEIQTLICGYNDLNCATLSLTNPFPPQVVWDRLDFPSALEDPDAALFDFDRDIMQSATIHPKRRFFRYLSLINEGEYANGLSIYMSRSSVVGLGAHFTRTSQFSGNRCGCELYFSLDLRERIAYAWLRIVNSRSAAFATPALAIETTGGRTHSFGPFIEPHLASDNRYRWLLLGQKGCVTGFYYENVKSGMTIGRLGVVGDGITARAAPLPPRYHNCDFPSPLIGSPNTDLFLSLAVLSDLKRVDACYVAKRCTGMLIGYHHSPTVVLGQWHTSRNSRHACIYEDSGATIANVCFMMSKSSRVVTAISFSPDMVEMPGSECHVFGIGAHIAWWFSERYDEILPWERHLSQVPAMSIMKHRL